MSEAELRDCIQRMLNDVRALRAEYIRRLELDEGNEVYNDRLRGRIFQLGEDELRLIRWRP